MKKTVAVASFVFAAAVVLWPSVTVGAPPTAGAQTFAAKCASCHGKDASGSTTMGKKMGLRPLGSVAVQKLTDKQLYDITAKGKKKMPAYEKKLTAVQIKELVSYMRTLPKQK